MVASERARDDLIRLGVSPDRVEVHAFPIHERFFASGRSREEIRRDLGIEGEALTMLATAGGQGIGKLTAFVDALYRAEVPITVIFVCGKNAAAKARLEKLAGVPSRTNLVVLGYVDNMNELLRAADFAAIKAGASATLEALAACRPPVVTDWAAGNEKPNMEYVVENDFGWRATSLRRFFSVVEEIMATDALERKRGRIAAAGIRSGAGEIAEFPVSALQR